MEMFFQGKQTFWWKNQMEFRQRGGVKENTRVNEKLKQGSNQREEKKLNWSSSNRKYEASDNADDPLFFTHRSSPLLSDGTVCGVWPDSDLHHQFQSGEDDLRALRAGQEDLPEPPDEVCGEEHRPGQ